MSGAPSFIPLSEPLLTPACAEAVQKQVQSGFVGPGAKSQEFGVMLAKEAGVEHALPMASGTVALSVAALVLGLRPGDEIIVPSYGVISVINAFASVGLKPKLADIDVKTGCISPAALEKAMTPNTKAVCFVDFGASLGPELDAVRTLCTAKKIPLIEDAAWALGRNTRGKKGGATGDVAITSFSVPKVMTTGQGGAVFLRSTEALNSAISFIDQGDPEWRKTGINRCIGNNLRLSDVSAALGVAQMLELNERHARKSKNYKILQEKLGERLFRASDDGYAAQYIVFAEKPNDLVTQLKAQNIGATRQYSGYYHQPCFTSLGSDNQFAGAAFWGTHAVYLPFGVGMTEEQAARIADATAAYNGKFFTP
jgi:perosamine synthetase